MKFTTKAVTKGLMIATVPIAIGSTIAITPSRAATLAASGATLLLENFNPQGNPDFLFSDANTSTNAISSPDSDALAIAPPDLNRAIVAPEQIDLSSVTLATGFGPNYLATAQSTSLGALQFDLDCGCFQFDFSAVLNAIAVATAPGEQASANSLVAFSIFEGENLIDSFEASLSANNPFNLVRSSDFINIDSIFEDEFGGIAIGGSYQRRFAKGTQLAVFGITRTDAKAVVPEPPMFAALVILPGLFWLKRRSKLKTLPQELSDRQSD